MSTDTEIQTPASSPETETPDLRKQGEGVPLFSLAELDPREVVEGVRVDAGLAAPDALPVGQMREVCPYCRNEPLQLVLRINNVIRTHLFCARCTRCFDALYPNGNSALLFSRLPAVY